MKEEAVEVNIRRIKWGLILTACIVVGVFVWMFFFGTPTCSSWLCFNDKLEDCKRASFVGGDKMIFEYTIRGDNSNQCVVNVKLLQGELNRADSEKLERTEMVCRLPLGAIMLPESDLSRCSGVLKENLQEIMIQKLHSYIAQNIGRINLDIVKSPTISEEVVVEDPVEL